MSRAPVIGIVGSGHVVPKFWGELPVIGTPTSYVEQVAAAGARPVVLPGRAALDLLDVVDGIVLTGGGDVDPARYGGPSGSANEVDPARDEVDLGVALRAQQQGIPLLGVCRGLQVLAVAFGGTLRADLGLTHVLPETGHPVDAAPGSLLHQVLGGRAETSSLHRQAIADPGPCWQPTGWAEDRVIEAAEWGGPGAWPVLGVQWHPELDGTGSALFGWLAATAKNHAEVRRMAGLSGR